MDAGTPAFSPRAANDAERRKVRTIRDIQFIARKNPGKDIQRSLPNFGYSEDELQALCEVAINTMDQGILNGLTGCGPGVRTVGSSWTGSQ